MLDSFVHRYITPPTKIGFLSICLVVSISPFVRQNLNLPATTVFEEKHSWKLSNTVRHLLFILVIELEYKIWRPAQKCDWRQQKWQHPGEAGIHSDSCLCQSPNRYYQENVVTFIACYDILLIEYLNKNLKIRRNRSSLSFCDGNLTAIVLIR